MVESNKRIKEMLKELYDETDSNGGMSKWEADFVCDVYTRNLDQFTPRQAEKIFQIYEKAILK